MGEYLSQTHRQIFYGRARATSEAVLFDQGSEGSVKSNSRVPSVLKQHLYLLKHRHDVGGRLLMGTSLCSRRGGIFWLHRKHADFERVRSRSCA